MHNVNIDDMLWWKTDNANVMNRNDADPTKAVYSALDLYWVSFLKMPFCRFCELLIFEKTYWIVVLQNPKLKVILKIVIKTSAICFNGNKRLWTTFPLLWNMIPFYRLSLTTFPCPITSFDWTSHIYIVNILQKRSTHVLLISAKSNLAIIWN